MLVMNIYLRFFLFDKEPAIAAKLFECSERSLMRWVERYKKVKDMLKKFYEEVKKHKAEDIICIDETSLNTVVKRLESTAL